MLSCDNKSNVRKEFVTDKLSVNMSEVELKDVEIKEFTLSGREAYVEIHEYISDRQLFMLDIARSLNQPLSGYYDSLVNKSDSIAKLAIEPNVKNLTFYKLTAIKLDSSGDTTLLNHYYFDNNSNFVDIGMNIYKKSNKK